MAGKESTKDVTFAGNPASTVDVGVGTVFDFTGPNVIDARELMDEIDWALVPSPRRSTFAVETADGRKLVTESEFDEWLRETRSTS